MKKFFSRLPELRSWLSNLSPVLRSALLIVVGLFVVAVLFWAIDKLLIALLAKGYADEVADAFGLNRYAARALFWISFAAAVICFRLLTSFLKSSRRIGAAFALILLVGHSSLLWYATRDARFDRQAGTALKWYVVTRDTIRYCTGPGTDELTGRECKPVTPEIAERLQKYKEGARPHRIVDPDTPVFASTTGSAIAWYSAESDKSIKLFDLMGFDPDSGAELKPITAEIANMWKAQTARRAPTRIDDPERYGFFDEINGKPRIWYVQDAGRFEFYDRPGFHPGTGEQLQPVDKRIVDEFRQSKSQKRNCYIITRDAGRPVIYGERPGIDAATGRQCYPLTVQVQERLNEYAKGRLPKRIDQADPVFFDMRTGEPIIWYARTKDGSVELFDLMGFHPGTGEELRPIDKAVAEEWKDKKARPSITKVPQRVQFGANTAVFDPVTGAPKLWYWRASKGNYEFFDASGFHPQNGEPLKSFSKEEAYRYQQELTEVIKDAGTTAAVPAVVINPDRATTPAQSYNGYRSRNRSVTRCDELAANPNDANHVGSGVPYEQLRFTATEAVDACIAAIKQDQSELRFVYQMARAMEALGSGAERKKNRERALHHHEQLAAKRYPAAFDNLGSLYRDLNKDYGRAAEAFREGVRLNDSDAMLSLADLIEHNRTPMMNESEQPLSLYKRAADLGNENGARAFQTLSAKVEQEERLRVEQQQSQQIQAAQQLQQQQMMINFLGTVLRNVPVR